MGQKTMILTQIGRFRTVTLVWIHWWLWNDAKGWSNIEELPYFFSKSSNFRVIQDKKIVDFDPNGAFLDYKSSLNFTHGFEMMHKAWCSIEKVPYCFPRTSIKFQGHTGQKNCRFWPELWVSRTATQVSIQPWFWNDAQSFMKYKKGVLLFSKVIHQIPSSHGTKNRQFWPELSVSRLQFQFVVTEGFDMMQKAYTRCALKFS